MRRLTIMLAILAGCSTTQPQWTAVPGSAPVASQTPSSIAPALESAGPRAGVSPPRSTSGSATASLPPLSSHSARPSQAPVEWTLLEELSALGGGHAWVSTTASGFLAVAGELEQHGDCPPAATAWISEDGLGWTPMGEPESLPGGPWIALGNSLFALSFRGTETRSCPGGAAVGWSVQRSFDGGLTWELLPQSDELRFARLSRLAAAGDRLLAVGSQPSGGPGEDLAGVWTSSDGIDWVEARRLPDIDHLGVLVAEGELIVAFGDDPGGEAGSTAAWYSSDAGNQWRAGRIRGLTQSSGVHISDVVRAADGFVAAGWTCCLDEPSDWLPLTLASADGVDWTAQVLTDFPWQQMALLTRLPNDRLLAVGSLSLYSDFEPPPGGPPASGGFSYFSPDGLDWHAGPALPELGSGFFTALAAGPAGVLLAGSEVIAPGEAGAEPRFEGDRGLRLWWMPLPAADGAP